MLTTLYFSQSSPSQMLSSFWFTMFPCNMQESCTTKMLFTKFNHLCTVHQTTEKKPLRIINFVCSKTPTDHSHTSGTSQTTHMFLITSTDNQEYKYYNALLQILLSTLNNRKIIRYRYKLFFFALC